MVEKQYIYDDRIYTVTACTKEDIPSHVERVLSYWKASNTNLVHQQRLLELAVENDTAYKVVDDTGKDRAVMYLLEENFHTVQCNLMWMDNKRMLAILCYYLKFRASYTVFKFTPHDTKFIPFKFLVPEISLRMYYTEGTPIEMYLNSKQSQMLYEDHFLRYNIKEIQ